MGLVTIDTLISIASALAAIVAAGFAYRSNAIASKALHIAQKDHEDKSANVATYLADSFRRKYDDEEVVAFAVVFINQADAPNSIIRIDLEIYYSKTSDTENHLIIPLSQKSERYAEFKSLQLIRTPLNLSARATESGWLIFVVPRKAITGSVDRYLVSGITATGKRVAIESYLVKEIRDEKQEED